MPSYRSYYNRLVISRRVTELILSTLLIYTGWHFALNNQFFTTVLPATGVGLAALFLRGNFLLSGIFVGTFLSFYHQSLPWPFSLIQGLIFTATLYSIRTVCLKWIGAVTPITYLSDLLKFMIVVSLFMWLPVLCLYYQLDYFRADRIYLTWLAYVNGVLCLVPLSLMFDPFVPKKYFHPKIQAWWVIGALLFLAHLGLFIPSAAFTLTLAIFSVISLNLYAYHFGQIAAGFTLLALSIIYLAGTLPFPRLFHDQLSFTQGLIVLTLFALSALSSLSVATVFAKRR